MSKIEEIVSQIEKLSVLEVSELVKSLEDKFGVSAAPMAIAAAPASADTGNKEDEEKDHHTVVLIEAGNNKINIIKAVREINPDLGLKDAKELVDHLPATVMENVPTEKAKEMQKKLEAAGAKVELK